jgi:trehalose-6-phosphate synthase
MRRLTVISNRLPLIIDEEEGRFSIREGAGGLVTAIKPLLMERGGAWIGFCGIYDADRGKGWEQTLADYGGGAIRYYPITPPRGLYEGYYSHYSNQELWPRFHSMTAKMSREAAKFWPDYVKMNELFADRTAEIAKDDGLIWIQDYHLMLLPRLLRERGVGAALGHFLHIPFPPAEVMAEQPHAREVLEGVLSSDLLGFHIPAYMHNFVESAEQILSAKAVERGEQAAVLEHGGRRIRLGAFPIGIQPKQLQKEQDAAAVRKRLPDIAERIILSMDRLDYTKAIPQRLQAYGKLLDDYPEYCGKLTLVQLVDLSRKSIPAYQEERDRVEEIIGEIERRHNSWKALCFAAERWQRKEVAGLMRMAKTAIITPRCDGMNLVAKEYVAAAPDDGVLVLSRQAGAAWQLGEHAVLVDGTSPESIVGGLRTALEMPEQERRARMSKLKENVIREDVFWWAGRFLEELQKES